MKQLGLKFCETQTVKGKVKEIMVMIDSEVLAEFVAEDFHKWLKEKLREIDEWLETGNVKKWHLQPLKIDKDKLRYLG